MSELLRCAYCKESIDGEPVVKLGKSYCSDACAFEATGRPRPKQCGVPTEGRADDTPSQAPPAARGR